MDELYNLDIISMKELKQAIDDTNGGEFYTLVGKTPEKVSVDYSKISGKQKMAEAFFDMVGSIDLVKEDGNLVEADNKTLGKKLTIHALNIYKQIAFPPKEKEVTPVEEVVEPVVEEVVPVEEVAKTEPEVAPVEAKEEVTVEQPRRRRGRPRKEEVAPVEEVVKTEPEVAPEEVKEEVPVEVPRRRGRPRRTEEEMVPETVEPVVEEVVHEEPVSPTAEMMEEFLATKEDVENMMPVVADAVDKDFPVEPEITLPVQMMTENLSRAESIAEALARKSGDLSDIAERANEIYVQAGGKSSIAVSMRQAEICLAFGVFLGIIVKNDDLYSFLG